MWMLTMPSTREFEADDINRENVCIHVGGPHNQPFGWQKIIYTCVKLLTARMELFRSGFHQLTSSYNDLTQNYMFLTIFIIICIDTAAHTPKKKTF